MERVQLAAVFSGHVQGVCFRAAVCDHAATAQVVGWVRNYSDGTVEMLAQGTQEQLDALLQAIQQKPGYGRVDRVKKSFFALRPISVGWERLFEAKRANKGFFLLSNIRIGT